jgi:hypothetical protein
VDEHFVYKMSKGGGFANTIGNGYAYGGSLTVGPAGGITYEAIGERMSISNKS